MPKNIVICLDGTGNEFGETNSNVVKIYTCLERHPSMQVTYYHPGLGTSGEMDRPTWTGRAKHVLKKILGMAFGYKIISNIGRAYRYLMNTYEPGDKIFLFGFSRGAYTAKALAALIHQFGILERGNDVLIPYMISLFKKVSRRNLSISRSFQSTFGYDTSIHFVGLWDAVSSVGWVYNPLRLPYTRSNPDIQIGRHALSIDEKRCFFRQNSWASNPPGRDIKEVWFAGVHSDIGGGYPEKESALSKISLAWMIDEAEAAGLLIDKSEKDRILGASEENVAPDFRGKIHKSLSGFWWAAEFLPRKFTDTAVSPPIERYYWPLGRSRFIPKNAVLHPSVKQRLADSVLNYKPTNLPDNWSTFERED